MQNLIKKILVVIIALMLMIPSSFVRVYAQEEETEIIEETVQEVVDTTEETIEKDKTEEVLVNQIGDINAPEENDGKGFVFFVNPYYEDIVDVSELVPAENIDSEYETQVDSNTQLVTSIEDGAELLYRMIRNHNTDISFRFSYKTNENITDAILAIRDKCTKLFDDYTNYSVMGVGCSYSTKQYTFDGESFYTVNTTWFPRYANSYEQEIELNNRLKEVLDDLDVYYVDEFTKIDKVYRYAMSNVVYDDAALEPSHNPNDYTPYSAWKALVQGTAVCQGYSNLIFRMLDALGVEVYIATGESNGERHAWNVVKLNNQYYNIDATWDSNIYEAYRDFDHISYFLKGYKSFNVDHTPDNNDRNNRYEVSETDYDFNSQESYGHRATSITLKPASDTLFAGDSLALDTIIEPSNIHYKNIIYTSSDVNVATVDNFGYVKTYSAGEVTITAKINELTATSKLTVIERADTYIPVTSVISLDSEINVGIGGKRKLNVTVEPENATIKNLYYISQNKDIAEVDQDGYVYGKSKGRAQIYAMAISESFTESISEAQLQKYIEGDKINELGDVFVRIPVNVNESIGVSGVTLDKENIKLETNEDEIQLIATVLPENAENKNVLWSSSDENVAVVSNSGVVTPVNNGTATITVTTEDGSYTDTCEAVVSIRIQEVIFASQEYYVRDKYYINIDYTLVPENADHSHLYWGIWDDDNYIDILNNPKRAYGRKIGRQKCSFMLGSEPGKLYGSTPYFYINVIGNDTYLVNFHAGDGKLLIDDAEYNDFTFAVNQDDVGVKNIKPISNDSNKKFSGWYTDEALTQKYIYSSGNGDFTYGGSNTVTSDLDLYAKYEDCYTVTFDFNGGYFQIDQDKHNTYDYQLAKGSYKFSWLTGGEIKNGENVLLYFEDENNNKYYLNENNNLANEDGEWFTSPNRNITFTAVWADTYTVRVVCDENSFFYENNQRIYEKIFNVKKGERVGYSPSTSGPYFCEGIYSDPEYTNLVAKNLYSYIPSGDITLYLKYEIGTKVTLQGNGGYFKNDVNQTSYIYQLSNRNIYSINYTPVRDGYAFKGWAFEEDASEPIVSLNAYEYGEEVTFYALWTQEYWVVRLFANEGKFSDDTSQKVLNVPKGNSLGSVSSNLYDPSKKDGVFVCWHTSEDLSEESAIQMYTNGYRPTSDIDLYARYVNSYTYTFDANGGSFAYDTITTRINLKEGFKYESSVENPTRDGYAFDGWYDNPEFSGEEETFLDHIIVGNKTYYAKWTDNVVTITYHGNGGVLPNGNTEYVRSYKYNDYVSRIYPSNYNFTRNGYLMDGVYLDQNCTQKVSKEYGFRITENRDYYVKWTSDIVTVNFDLHGGQYFTTLEPRTIIRGQRLNFHLGTPSHPTKAFAGWSSDIDGHIGDNYQLSGYAPTDNTTVSAVWTDDYYTVTIHAGIGSIYDSVTSKNYKDLDLKVAKGFATDANSPSATNYVFVGLYSDPEFNNLVTTSLYDYVPTSDIELYAKYEKNDQTPTITIKLEGGYRLLNGVKYYGDYTLSYYSGNNISLTSGNYIFDNIRWVDDSKALKGFSLTPNGEILRNIILTEDTILYAIYSDEYYTVTLDYNGGRLNNSSSESIKVVPGNRVNLNYASHPEGLPLKGYYTNLQQEGTKYTAGDYFWPTKDITLYAAWSNVMYTLDFVVNNGTLVNANNYSLPIYYNVDDYAYSLYNITAKSNNNLKFVGWYDNPEFEGNPYDASHRMNGDLILYAKFADKYTIIFNSNGRKFADGTTTKTIQLTPGKMLADIRDQVPKPDTSGGYTFYNWTTKEDGTGLYYSYYSDIDQDLVLYANWTEIPIDVTSVTINEDINTMVEGSTTQLTVSFLPENATYKNVWWSSSDETIATVDYDGNVTALKPGTVTIKASNTNEIYDEITITVTEIEKHIVTFNSDGGTLIDSQRVVDGQKVTKPQDPTKDGFTFIGWYLNGILYNFDSTVTSNITLKAVWEEIAYATNIVLDETQHSMYVGDEYNIVATIEPTSAANQGLTYASNDTSIATVDSNGLVRAVSSGNTYITITTEDGNASVRLNITVNVKPEQIDTETLLIDPQELTIKVNQDGQFTVHLPEDYVGKEVLWRIDDSSIASIDQTGKVTGIKVGETTVSASLSDSGMNELLQALALAQQAYNNAKENEDNAIILGEAAKTNFNNKNAIYEAKLAEENTAKNQYNDSVAAKQTAQSELEAAQTAKANADTAVTNAQTAKANAENEVATKTSELQTATTNVTTAQAELATAQTNLENYQAQMDSKLNSYEFFKWVANSSSQSQSVKNGAALASRILDNTLTSSDRDYIVNDGGYKNNMSMGSPSATYNQIIGYTNIGAENDATQWDNFKYALQQIQLGNTYRAKENLHNLKVSSILMAVAEVNANYQKSLPGDIEHAKALFAGENLAMNSSSSSRSYPSFGQYDPYSGWYTNEKKVYDYCLANNLDYDRDVAGNLELRRQIAQTLGLLDYYGNPRPDAVQVGHYLTLTDKRTVFYGTGFGYVTEREYSSPWYTSTEKYAQSFNYQPDNDSLTVSAYNALVQQYENSFAETEASLQAIVDQKQTALNTANQAKTNAENALQQANTNLTTANNNLQTALNNQTDAQSLVTQKQNALDACETDVQNKLNAYQQAQQDTADALRDKEQAQTDYSQAQQNTQAAAAIVAQKQEEVDIANNNIGRAQGTARLIVISSIKGIVLDDKTLTINKGTSRKLTYTISPDDATNTAVTWTSSNPNIVSVDSEGNITALKSGTVTIIVRTQEGGHTDTCEVTVLQLPESLELNKTDLTLYVEDEETLIATILPQDTDDKSLTWTSSDETVATVDENGVVKAKKAGTATITVKTINNITETCEVTVKQLATSIELNKTTLTLEKGTTETLIATILPDDITDKKVTWTSSNPDVVSVDENGKVTALKATDQDKPVTITVRTSNGQTATCDVEVKISVSDISLNKSSTTLNVGDIDNLIATIVPDDATNKNVTWTSSNPYVVSVDSNGNITAVKKGTATITATSEDGGYEAKCNVTVNPLPESVSLNRTTLELENSKTETLIATISPQDAGDKTLTWTSSNTSVATVDQNGKITAKAQGTTTITVKTSNNKSATCTVTVKKQQEALRLLDVKYRTHVQSYGWQSYVSNGEMSGTSGKSKRLEGINIYLSNTKGYDVGIKYTTHCQSYGWLPWVSNDEMSGTSGESKRLESIKIELTGSDANMFDVYYRVHAQTYGWLSWAKNGEEAGTAGLSKRLEGIQIIVVEKGDSVPSEYEGIKPRRSEAFIGGTSSKKSVIKHGQTYPVYSSYVQSRGWMENKYNGMMSGTTSKSKRLEAIKINLEDKTASGSIRYNTHVQGVGWQGWKYNGDVAGLEGQGKRIEAIKIELTGELAKQYDIYYRLQVQSYGWLSWAKNGEMSGTSGLSKCVESIQIIMVKKGANPPSDSHGGYRVKTNKTYIKK